MKKSIFSLLLSALLLVYFSPARTFAEGETILASVRFDETSFSWWDFDYSVGGYYVNEGDGILNVPIVFGAFPEWDGKPVAVGVQLSYSPYECFAPKYGEDIVFENADYVSTVQQGAITAINGVMYFTQESEIKNLQLRLIDDSISECKESLAVSLIPADYLQLDDYRNVADIDIFDNDETTIGFRYDTTYKVNEDGVRGDIQLIRMGDLSKTSTVDFEFTDGTAHYGSDYSDLNPPQTVTFAPNAAGGSASFRVLNDYKGEKDESFSINLKNPTNTALRANSTANVTISDDDQQYLELDKTSYEGTEGGKVTVTIKRIGKPTGIVSAYLCSCDTTAKGGLDYVETPVALVFGNGVTSKTITIDLKDDDLVEDDETFMMKIVAANSSFPFKLDELSKAPVTIHDADS